MARQQYLDMGRATDLIVLVDKIVTKISDMQARLEAVEAVFEADEDYRREQNWKDA